MRPIVVKGHSRPLTQLKFNREGDLLFSTARDQVASVWFSHNGERLGTFSGHGGAIFSIDVDPTTTVAITGAADSSIRLWDVKTGQNTYKWDTKATARYVQFSPDAKQFLAVTEEHMGQKGSIALYNVSIEDQASQEPEPTFVIRYAEGQTKFTTAAWTYDGKHIVAGHSNGEVSKYDVATGELVSSVTAHEGVITDLQMSPDRTYFITSSKDKTGKLIRVDDLEILRVYVTETPMNSAAITPIKDFIVIGGGQEARDVTTTAAREGKFESRFYHKLFEDEVGRVKGHFGPINTIVIHPKGTGYASGGEDGFVRIHHFDKSYFDFMYEVERR
ncbi:translation initiation factor eIF3 subunit i [Sugiyamaella lignohabitans]|uniref:Eukaryotic translation initiation factor 3 subunit I n=1 Tax=Sugiyamaella lignohabitans TaxID=796027 RepID=A0A161HLB9_9ASCO|nr:translation initiation factor eIF3 subunit i [Sugiyamaella lignohabitans]ANB14087.1 translation initiation factor eIF3 subunit i [Sugiyamaella lignohabitans]